MLLKRILLENFRQYLHADVPLQPGLTAIVGPNGSGKTTLIEAIGFALYGEQRGEKKDIKPIHHAGGKPRVALWFELGGNSYMVSRELTKAILRDETNDRVLAETLSGVTQEVERRFRLTYEQFTNSFCTEQKGLLFLQFRDPRRKIEELARMLGYDRLKTASRIAERQAAAARGRREGAQMASERLPIVQAEYDSAKRDLQIATEERERAEKAHGDLLAAVSALAKQREAAEEALVLLREIQGLEERRELLEQSAQEREQEKQEAEQRLAERKALEESARRYEELNTSRRALEVLKEQAEAQASLQAEIQHLENQLAERRKRISEIGEVDIKRAELDAQEAIQARSEAEAEVEAQRKSWEERRASAQQQVAALSERKAGLEREIHQLEKAVKGGVCMTCGQSLPGGRLPAQTEKSENLKQVVEELSVAEKALAAEEAEPEQLRLALDSLERARGAEQLATQTLATVRAQHKVLEEEQSAVARLEAQLTEKRAALGEPVSFDQVAWAEVTTQLESLDADYRRYLATADAEERFAVASRRLSEAQEQVATIVAEIRQRRERLQQSGLDQSAAEEIVAEYEKRKREGERAAVELEAATRRLADMQQRMLTAEQNLQAIEDALREERAAAEEELLNKTLAKALDALSRELTEQIRPDLQRYASDYLAALSRGRYTELDLTEDFRPVLMDRYGEGVGKKHVISGGEQDIVMLSLRLALSQLIRAKSGQPFGLLILDEVFGSLDEERRQSVMEQLRVLSDMFQQVLVISHIEGINEAADRVIEVQFDPVQRKSVVRGHDIAEQPISL